MQRLDHARQKLITHLLTMQNILILLYQCIICLGIVAIILLYQEVCGIIRATK